MLLALLVAGITLWVWGGLDVPPIVQDESSYLLQAQLFASGQLVGASPPLPRFFDQYHVIVEPVLATKYTPMHSLFLVPGVLLGLPGLMPLLQAALSTFLVHRIGRRVIGAAPALLATVTWALFTEGLHYRASYMSHSTSELFWLVAVWASLRAGWWTTPVVALSLGAVFLTRPLTAVGLLPGTLWLWYQPRGRPTLRALLGAAALFGLGVLLLLGWDYVVCGSPLPPTWSFYARQYLPGDGFGFGWQDGAPLIPYDADRAQLAARFRAMREGFVPDRLPLHLSLRLTRLWDGWFGAPGSAWALPFVAGLLGTRTAAGAPLRALCAAWLGLFLVHVPFPHEPWLLRYYREAELVPALVGAWGVWLLARTLQASARAAELDRLAASGGTVARMAAAALGGLRHPALVWLLLALAAWPALRFAPISIGSARSEQEKWARQPRHWREALAALPGDRHLVFVRYAPDHEVYTSLIANEGDLAHARVWTVADRGIENAQLQALAPDRRAWRYDEATDRFTPL